MRRRWGRHWGEDKWGEGGERVGLGDFWDLVLGTWYLDLDLGLGLDAVCWRDGWRYHRDETIVSPDTD